jgi:hypothetical protein
MVVHSIHPDVMRPAAYESVMTDYERDIVVPQKVLYRPSIIAISVDRLWK